MTKLNKKLSISICIAVILVSAISLTINKLFIHRYYLHEKKQIINDLGEDISDLSTQKLISEINKLEQEKNVTIAYTPVNLNSVNVENEVSENLSYEFWKKGISLKKFWISKDSLYKLNEQSVNKIYNQGKSKYSLLVKFIKKDNYIFAIGTTIEHSQETIEIINRFNIIMSAFSVILISILTFILSNKIIKPIEKLKLLSNDISKLKFRTEEIKTNDEIEELSQSINKMSINLEKAHNELNNRNESLKQFISDASHEMKTPVALIKAYAIGIQDGIDDGTFIDTVIEQSEHLTDLINTLLYWSKYEKKEFNMSNFDLKEKLIHCIKKYEILIEERDIKLNVNIDNDNFMINADENSIEIVLNNLISNAIKYNSNNKINIFLLKDNDEIFVSVKNGINNINKEEIANIWKPFYVLESSRSKELSGTGLGLSIVKEILEAHKFEYGTDINDEDIEFFFIVKN
ncbi:sensor histidine kinase [Romboutsia lituseburensis]|uniref:sensor histidine kinase n=1 Tax=Romboutsia lituseburensis TaxID=1537 RepID=UPI0022EAF5FE|nr:HAMP domain-containing sensor histidine kinase [Romboutsia lituseburensis]